MARPSNAAVAVSQESDAAPPPAWPGDVPTDADAETLLASALAGLKAAGDAALDATLDALTSLERDALEGRLDAPDPAPLRRAATLRYRVASALGSAPAPGSTVDGEVARALLGAIDEVLAAIGALDAGARAAELDAIRRALVKEAVDFSELAQRLAPREEPAPAEAPRPAGAPALPGRKPGSARLLSYAPPQPGGGRSTRAYVALAVVALLVVGYHASRLLGRPSAPTRPSVPGAPEGAFGYATSGGSRVVIAGKSGSVSPAEAARFEEQERAAGRIVREVAPGVFVSMPSTDTSKASR